MKYERKAGMLKDNDKWDDNEISVFVGTIYYSICITLTAILFVSHTQQKWFTSIFDRENEEPAQVWDDKQCSRNSKRSRLRSYKQKRQRLSRTSSQNSLKSDENSSGTQFDNSQGSHTNLTSSNWTEKFAPQSIDDLAVHPKKVEEIRDWIKKWQSNEKNGSVLLLTGPPGSGKTATVRLIAKDLNFDVSEWIVPLDIDLNRNYGQDDDNVNTYTENQFDKFSDFLNRSSRFASVFDNQRRRLLLVEDFPNIFIKDPEKFNELLG